MEAKLQAALNRIQELESENKKLREQIIELQSENKQMEENCEELDEECGGIIQSLKSELKELKQRVENLENNVDYDDGIRYPEAQTEKEAQWFDLKVDNDYEIKNIYPYDIRRKSNEKIVKEGIDKNSGYIQIGFNKKYYKKHILVAKHFIPNDDPINKKIVDHKNHIRTDYHISNLRWVSASENSKNKSSHKGVVYEYVDTIPEEAIRVDSYGNNTFDNYYFYDNIFYFYTGINYKKLHIHEDKYGNKSVYLINEDGKNIKICYCKFKKLYDIPFE